MRAWIRWSVWLCLSLMLWTAAVESTHTHPSPSEVATCSICAVAHTARPAITAAHSTPVFVAIGIYREGSVVAKAHVDSSDLGIRGPPLAI